MQGEHVERSLHNQEVVLAADPDRLLVTPDTDNAEGQRLYGEGRRDGDGEKRMNAEERRKEKDVRSCTIYHVTILRSIGK